MSIEGLEGAIKHVAAFDSAQVGMLEYGKLWRLIVAARQHEEQRAEIERLRATNAELVAMLIDARKMFHDWATYAGDYFREKHDLAGDMAKLDAAIDKATKP